MAFFNWLYHYGPWLLLMIVIVALWTNCFGLLGQDYKGTWVSIKHESMPEVMKRLKAAKAFYDSEGMYKDLEMNVCRTDDNVTSYSIKIPEYVFHSVERELILQELGIK